MSHIAVAPEQLTGAKNKYTFSQTKFWDLIRQILFA